MYGKGETTGSNKANREMVAKHYLQMSTTLTATEEELLDDPQTSGGLLLSLPESQVEPLLSDIREAGVISAVKIGEVIDEPVGITVV
jgi:selenide,water dikinase